MRQIYVFILLVSASLFLGGCTQKKKITSEIQAFEKPKSATIRLEGQNFPYCVWYNPNQWIILDTPFDGCDTLSEWSLVLVDLDEQVSLGKDIEKRAFAKTYTYEEKNVARATFKEFVQSKIFEQDKENFLMFKDLGSEERIVNNIKVLAWKFMVEYEHVGQITSFLYFYSDNEGSVAITTFTPTDQWKKNEEAMEAFLNGFCLLQSP